MGDALTECRARDLVFKVVGIPNMPPVYAEAVEGEGTCVCIPKCYFCLEDESILYYPLLVAYFTPLQVYSVPQPEWWDDRHKAMLGEGRA